MEETYQEGGDEASFGHGSPSAPACSQPTSFSVEYQISTLGLRLTKQGAEVVILEMDDDVARVRLGYAWASMDSPLLKFFVARCLSQLF